MFSLCRFNHEGVLVGDPVAAATDLPVLAAGEWLWLHLEGESAGSEDRLLARLGIHLDEMVLIDARRERHPPKYEHFENCAFLMLRELQPAASHQAPETQSLSVMIGERFVVSRALYPSAVAAALQAELREGAVQARKGWGPSGLAYRLMRRLVDAYQPMLMALEEDLAGIEDDLLSRPQEAHLNQLMAYSSAIKKLRRRLVYQTGAFRALMESEEGRNLHLFQDLYENSERYSSLCHLYQELMADLINGFMSVSTHKLNNIMKVLTIVTVVFMPLTLLAGIYGMNFAHMPELGWRYGYFAVLGLMLGLAFAMMAVFRYLRWL